MDPNDKLGMKIPEFELWKLLNLFKLYTIQDISNNQSNYSKSFLWSIFGKNEHLEDIDFGSEFNFYKQSVEIFIRKTRELSFSIGYNLKKATTPTIHIVLPGETPISAPIGSNDGYQGFSKNDDQYSSIFTYSNRSTYNLIITSENLNEVVLIYHWLKACFGSMVEQLELRGFQNPDFGGNDIGINEELVPNHVFYRNFNVNFTYEWSVKSIHSSQILGNLLSVSGNGISTNPNTNTNNCPTLLDYLEIATGQYILSLLSQDQIDYISSQICGSSTNLDTIIRFINFQDIQQATQAYQTIIDGANIRPDIVIPSRQILNSLGQPGTNRKIDLSDLISGTLPVALDVEVRRDNLFFAFKESGGIINVPSNCAPTTVNGVQSTVTAIVVVRDGLETGTLNPTTGVVTVPSCPVVLIEIRINDTFFTNATSSPRNISVRNTNDREKGSIVSGNWVFPNTTIQLKRVSGDPIGSPQEFASGDPHEMTVPNGTATLRDSSNVIIGGPFTVEPGNNRNISAPDARVLRDGVEFGFVKSAGQIDVLSQCSPVTIQLVDSSNNPIGSPDIYNAGVNTTKTAPNGTVIIQNSVLTPLQTVIVRSNGSATQAIADSTITRPDGTTEGLPATVALDVRNYRSGIAYSFGRVLHTGQTAAFRTGDESSMFADGFFDYTRPVYPSGFADLGADFVTLASNNMYGNTLRFTARGSGAAAPTSGNRWIRDHFLGVDWYVLGTLLTGSWNTAVDSGITLRTTLGEGGIYTASKGLVDLISDEGLAAPLNYAPFNITLASSLWTSTTNAQSTANAYTLTSNGSMANGIAKTLTTLRYGIYCKRFA